MIISRKSECRYNPRHVIFGGKAAPGYYMAKDIIKLIWSIGQEFARNTRVRDKIRVIYLEDYNVTTTETLMPASDISEQISLAGKEASGTGCMKFMINGALTLGTLDGANIEMMEKAGAENFFIFGLNSTEVDELWKRGYDSAEYCRKSERLSKTVETLRRGFTGIPSRGWQIIFFTARGSPIRICAWRTLIRISRRTSQCATATPTA